VIPPAVRAAFGLHGDGVRLPGGVTGVVRFGDVVVKPVADAAEAEWEQAAFAILPMPADVRWARPVASRDGRFVVDGWIADEFVPDLTPVAPDWSTVIELGRRFHRATRSLPIPTALLAARRHRWARAERHAFDEGRVPLDGRLAAIDTELASRCAPDRGPAQVVHVDLTTNVFLDGHGVPTVLDIAPGGRSPAYPGAVVVADALVWHGADLHLLDRVDPDPGSARALVARALRFRLVTDHLAAADRSPGVDLQPYRAVLDEMS
jgi:uncharacterized protein (TIGR02569 family)